MLLFVLAAISAEGALAAAKKKRQAKPAAPLDPPLTVVLVRADESQCGNLCPEWLMAEGRLTEASPAAFRKALKKAGRKKLPVVINSPGGSVVAALEIGRLIRKNKLDVAVGRTRYSGCAPADTSCTLPKPARGTYRGTLRADNAYCFSACPLVLAGGTRRVAGLGSHVGVHQVETRWTQDSITYRETYRIVNGKKKVVSRKEVSRKRAKSYTTVGLYKDLRRKLTSYLATMGVKAAFLDLMEKAPPNAIYALSFEQMRELNLVTSRQSVSELAGPMACNKSPAPPHCLGQTGATLSR